MGRENLRQLLPNKKGAMEIEELVKLLIAITIFLLLVAGVIFLLSGKGSETIESIKNAIRFGR